MRDTFSRLLVKCAQHSEALPSLWWLYQLSQDATYLDRLESTLGWIEAHQVDAEYGEWYWGIGENGSPISSASWPT